MAEKKQKKQRVDSLLISRKLCSSLKEAQALVYADKVYTHDRKIKKPSELLPFGSFLGLKGKESQYVSRGGDKLFGALEQLGLLEEIKGTTILDIGSSTGGFTDCLLQKGAKQVVAVDVGHNQLSWKLQKDPRVTSLEGTHIKDLQEKNKKPYDFIVADISFNSLENLAPYIACASTKQNFSLLLLVKPQFELPREKVPTGGVVTNDAHKKEAVEKAVITFEKLGLFFVSQVESPIKGRTGNTEIFIYLKKASLNPLSL